MGNFRFLVNFAYSIILFQALCLKIICTCIIITSLLVLPYSYPENITPDSEVEPKTMTIGMNNVFEVGCGILFEYTF